MAEKTRANVLKTRQSPTGAAVVQFAARGVNNIALSDITDAVSVTCGALCQHFESKTRLFNKLWLQQPPLRDLIQDKLIGRWGDNPLQRLREGLVAGLQYTAENPRQQALMQVLCRKCEFHNDIMSEQIIRDKIGTNHQSIHDSLQKCIDDNLIATTLDSDVITIILHGSFNGTIKNWLMNPVGYDLYRQILVLVDSVLKMLSPSGSVMQLIRGENQVGQFLPPEADGCRSIT